MNIPFTSSHLLHCSTQQHKPTHIFTLAAEEKHSVTNQQTASCRQNIQSMISIYPNDFDFGFSLTFSLRKISASSQIPPT